VRIAPIRPLARPVARRAPSIAAPALFAPAVSAQRDPAGVAIAGRDPGSPPGAPLLLLAQAFGAAPAAPALDSDRGARAYRLRLLAEAPPARLRAVA